MNRDSRAAAPPPPPHIISILTKLSEAERPTAAATAAERRPRGHFDKGRPLQSLLSDEKKVSHGCCNCCCQEEEGKAPSLGGSVITTTTVAAAAAVKESFFIKLILISIRKIETSQPLMHLASRLYYASKLN